jgi:uncharacterized protein (TIGR03083 family)
MPDRAEIYDLTRKEVASFVSSLTPEDLDKRVPATPAWTIRDVIAHLTGDIVCTAKGDFPREFFESLGSAEGIAVLNRWTERQVEERRGRPLQDLLDEWEAATPAVTSMMRGDTAWPEAIMSFAGHILLTDIGTHQQDIFGALGLKKDRDAAVIRIGVSTFIGGAGLRLQMTGGPSLRFVMEDKEAVAGGGDPVATVRAPRFEFFRAMSGRRNPDQIRAYDWEGDPEPFIPVFFPYGIREDALVE